MYLATHYHRPFVDLLRALETLRTPSDYALLDAAAFLPPRPAPRTIFYSNLGRPLSIQSIESTPSTPKESTPCQS